MASKARSKNTKPTKTTSKPEAKTTKRSSNGKGLVKQLSKGKVVAAATGVLATAAAGYAAVKGFKGRSSDGSRIYHVRPEGEGWRVEAEGAERATSTHPNKREALAAARALAHKHEPCELIIHAQDGSVQKHHTYGEPASA